MSKDKIKFPLQPIKEYRFVKNSIVEFLLNYGLYDLNQLAVMDFTREEREQFDQLSGYSLSGYSELSYVSDDSYDTASIMAENENMNELMSENIMLKQKLDETRAKLKELAPILFHIHPDDLTI